MRLRATVLEMKEAPSCVRINPERRARICSETCSVHFGKNITSAAPGSAKAFLIVTDVDAARDHLVAAGVEVGEFFHDGPEGRSSGLHPERLSRRSPDMIVARRARSPSTPRASRRDPPAARGCPLSAAKQGSLPRHQDRTALTREPF
jgi:hypothetical protein